MKAAAAAARRYAASETAVPACQHGVASITLERTAQRAHLPPTNTRSL